MKTIQFLLINSLRAIMQLVVDHCESILSHFGLICWAINKGTFTSGTYGTIDRWIFYDCNGNSLIRSRPSHFRIKNKSAWKNRWSKHAAYFNCARCMNNDLPSLFQGKEPRRSLFNTLCSHLSKFWVKQNDGSYLFSPGIAEVRIGNGSLPDARDFVFSSTSVNTLSIAFDNTVQYQDIENNDDTLQLMFIDEKGKHSFWVDLTSVTRSSGSVSYIIPEQFGSKIYPAIKFRANAQYAGNIKGIFRFPKGIKPVTILR